MVLTGVKTNSLNARLILEYPVVKRVPKRAANVQIISVESRQVNKVNDQQKNISFFGLKENV